MPVARDWWMAWVFFSLQHLSDKDMFSLRANLYKTWRGIGVCVCVCVCACTSMHCFRIGLYTENAGCSIALQTVCTFHSLCTDKVLWKHPSWVSLHFQLCLCTMWWPTWLRKWLYEPPNPSVMSLALKSLTEKLASSFPQLVFSHPQDNTGSS